MEKASQKYREAPDVYFRDAHKIIVRIVTNIVSDPEEAKFRQINMKGKAFHSVAEAAGAVDVLLFLGFRVEGDFLTLPPGREIDPASLDFLLRIEEIREQEKMEREAKKAAKASKEKEQKSKAMQEKLALDRVEASQKIATSSKSTLVPFSGRDKVGLKDIGAGDAAKQGG